MCSPCGSSVATVAAAFTPGTFTLATAAGGGGNIALATINTISAAIALSADGAIANLYPTASQPNLVTSTQVSLTANQGIGAAGTGVITTTVRDLQATNNIAGPIYLNETATLNIWGTGVRNLGGSGPIVITVTTGDLTVSSPVTDTGTGNILLQPLAAGAALTTNGSILAAGGNVVLLSPATATINAPVSAGGAGNILIQAQLAGAGLLINGSVLAANGNVILLSPATATINASVGAGGSGNVLIQSQAAGAALAINAGVSTVNGSLSLLAPGSVVVNNGAIVAATGLGTIDIEAATGSLLLRPASGVTAASGDIRLLAATDVTLSTVATGGNVSVIAQAGAIINGEPAGTLNVIANGLRLSAATAVGSLGTGATPIAINVTTVSARASAGGINLLESDGLTVGDTRATVQQVRADGSTTPITDATQSDLRTTAGNGAIVLVATTGTITLNDGTAPTDQLAISANGSGTVTVTSGGAITLSATGGIASATGAITLTAGTNLTLGTVASAGNLTLTAGVDLALGIVTSSGNVRVTATAGVITDHEAATVANITAPTLQLVSGAGMGTTAIPVVVAVPTLSAHSTNGDVHIRNLLTVPVTLTDLSTGTGTLDYSQVGGNLQVNNAATTNGTVKISLDNGDIHATTVTAGGAGVIDLTVIGVGKIKYDQASAGGGAINVATTNLVTLDNDVVTQGEAVTFTGPVILPKNTTITTNGGAVTFTDVLDGAFTLTINAGGGAVTFVSPVGQTTPLASLSVTTTGAVTVDHALTVVGVIVFNSGSLTLAGGAGSVKSTSGANFIAAPATDVTTLGVGGLPTANTYAYVLTPTTLAALAPGFGQILLGRADGTGHIDVGDATFLSPAVIQTGGLGGTLTVLTGRTITVAGAIPVTLIAGTGDSGALSVAAGATIAAGSGTITLSGDTLTLAATAILTGTGVLVLEPTTLNRDIVVGATGTAGQFVLTAAEVLIPATSFSGLQIGRANGTGTLNVYATTYRDSVIFDEPAGAGVVNFNAVVTTSLAGNSISANAGSDVVVVANLTVGISGSINLTADADHSHAGSVIIAPSAIAVVRTPSGDIVLNGASVLLGSAGFRSELIATGGGITLLVDPTGSGAGSLVIANNYSQIKASGNLTITTGPLVAGAADVINLLGQLQALGSVTIVSNSAISGSNFSLTAAGDIALTAAGDVRLDSGGSVYSQTGNITLTADSNHDGVGDLLVGSAASTLISGAGNVLLNGENVSLGGATSFARVMAGGNLSIGANLNRDGRGSFLFTNALSTLTAGGDVSFGNAAYGAGTAVGLTLSGGAITAGRTFAATATGDITFTGTISAASNLSFGADGAIAIDNGTLTSGGAQLQLLADVNRSGFGAVTLADATTLTAAAATVTFSGYDVTVGTTVKITPAPVITRFKP